MLIFSGMRQLMYAREFRIVEVPWPPNLEELLMRIVHTNEGRQASPETGMGEQEARLLSDIGTGLWRLRQKMVKPGTAQPLDEMRRPYRHLESVWDALVQAGVEIQDHTDKPFDDGMSLTVVAYQATPGLGRQRVIETIKPTIYFKSHRIQRGEVIVGTPEAGATAPRTEYRSDPDARKM